MRDASRRTRARQGEGWLLFSAEIGSSPVHPLVMNVVLSLAYVAVTRESATCAGESQLLRSDSSRFAPFFTLDFETSRLLSLRLVAVDVCGPRTLANSKILLNSLLHPGPRVRSATRTSAVSTARRRMRMSAAAANL